MVDEFARNGPLSIFNEIDDMSNKIMQRFDKVFEKFEDLDRFNDLVGLRRLRDLE